MTNSIFLVVALGYLLYIIFYLLKEKKKRKIVSATFNTKTSIINVEFDNEEIKQYILTEMKPTIVETSSKYLWRTIPEMELCGGEKSKMLSNIYKYIKKFGNPYPSSHENIEEEKILETQKDS